MRTTLLYSFVSFSIWILFGMIGAYMLYHKFDVTDQSKFRARKRKFLLFFILGPITIIGAFLHPDMSEHQ